MSLRVCLPLLIKRNKTSKQFQEDFNTSVLNISLEPLDLTPPTSMLLASCHEVKGLVMHRLCDVLWRSVLPTITLVSRDNFMELIWQQVK